MAAAYEIQGRDANLFGAGPVGPTTSGSLGVYIQGITTGGFSSVGGNTAGPSIVDPTTNGSQALDGSNVIPAYAGGNGSNLANLSTPAGAFGVSPLVLLLGLGVVVLLGVMVLRK